LAELATQQKTDRSTARLRLREHSLTADCSGVLWWPEFSTLVVSDLHLEKGSSFARKGMMVPPHDTRITLEKLAQTVGRYQPERIISLGDSFHDGGGAARLPLPEKQALLGLMANREWIWISGNHDPEPPEGLPGICQFEFALGDLIFRHEPSEYYARGEVAGHLHPAGKIKARGAAVRRPCFISDTERLIMPAFGAFTGGLNVCSKPFAGIFDKKRQIAHLMSGERIYAVRGTDLC
jgi:hypothetical protein